MTTIEMQVDPSNSKVIVLGMGQTHVGFTTDFRGAPAIVMRTSLVPGEAGSDVAQQDMPAVWDDTVVLVFTSSEAVENHIRMLHEMVAKYVEVSDGEERSA